MLRRHGSAMTLATAKRVARAIEAIHPAMKPEVILHSFGYLTQAAATTIAVSFAGIALGFADRRRRLRRARVAARPGSSASAAPMSACSAACRCWCSCCSSITSSPNSASTCRRSSRRSAGSRSRRPPIRRRSCAARSTPCRAARARRRSRSAFAGLDIWRRILLPQALRISVPPLINEFILLLKASSLVSVVGIAELTRVSMNIASHDLSAARGLCRRRPLLSRDQSLPGGVRRARRAAARGGRAAR